MAVTRFFIGLLLHGQPGRYWPEIWPAISDQDLAYRINFQALSWSEATAAFFIAAWVYVVLTMLASFVVSRVPLNGAFFASELPEVTLLKL